MKPYTNYQPKSLTAKDKIKLREGFSKITLLISKDKKPLGLPSNYSRRRLG